MISPAGHAPSYWISTFLFVGLLAFAPAHASLTPVRSTVDRDGYTIDVVGDKKDSPTSDTLHVIIRVTHGNKTPIKPRDVVLVAPGGRVIDNEDRDDKDAGSDHGSGLPVILNPSADTGGGVGLGIGIDLSRLGSSGPYSYSRIEFKRSDFVSGNKLRIRLPDGEVLLISLTSISE